VTSDPLKQNWVIFDCDTDQEISIRREGEPFEKFRRVVCTNSYNNWDVSPHEGMIHLTDSFTFGEGVCEIMISHMVDDLRYEIINKFKPAYHEGKADDIIAVRPIGLWLNPWDETKRIRNETTP